MKKLFGILAVLCGIVLISCSSERTALSDTDRAAIAQAIENHDNTLIYIWSLMNNIIITFIYTFNIYSFINFPIIFTFCIIISAFGRII